MQTEGTAQALYAQFVDAQKVAAIVVECAKKVVSRTFEDFRDGFPSTFMNQWPYGVAVEFVYGNPHRIFTSCGAWRVADLMEANYGQVLLKHPRLKFEILKEAVMQGGWRKGPIYFVKEIDGDALPQPFQRDRLWSPQQCKVMWASLLGRYAAEQLDGKTPFNAQLKSYPEDGTVHGYRDQYVTVSKIDAQGLASCVTSNYTTIEVHMSDLVLFSSGLIK